MKSTKFYVLLNYFFNQPILKNLNKFCLNNTDALNSVFEKFEDLMYDKQAKMRELICAKRFIVLFFCAEHTMLKLSCVCGIMFFRALCSSVFLVFLFHAKSGTTECHRN